MLKYIYTNRYELPDSGTLLVTCFLFPIGLYVLADKYYVEGLANQATANFACACTWCTNCGTTLLDEESILMVKAYYGIFAQVGSDMGRFMVNYMLHHSKAFMGKAAFATLVREYPALGADIVLAEMKRGCLGECTKRQK
jgi:hypothetical protein